MERMAARPPTSGRPLSGMQTAQRPPPSSLPSRAGVPGTATRLISTASQRPNSRANVKQSQGMMSYLTVTDRPMSQQGLITPKTSGRMSQRQVQDKSYYMGLLRAKTSELRNEIVRMSHEIEVTNKEQATFLTYEKRAETLAAELKELQGELADYNLLVDKINTDTEMEDVQVELKEIMVCPFKVLSHEFLIRNIPQKHRAVSEVRNINPKDNRLKMFSCDTVTKRLN